MNDFTKEELETIFLDMNHNILKYGKENIDPFYLNLRDKVEVMIDNYCEHEFQIKSLTPHFLMMREKCSKTFVDGSFPG